MNEDEMAVAEPLAGEELERTLGRYARVRLDPSQAQRRRARSAVMEEAWRRRIDPTGSVAAAAAYRPVRRALFAGWTTRRIAASLSAAVLVGLMVGSSVFAASRAGGPLYESRIALEALTLPSDASARVDAELAQAQARLAEAVEATGRHDDRAAIAALDAYDAAIDRLTTAGGRPPPGPVRPSSSTARSCWRSRPTRRRVRPAASSAPWRTATASSSPSGPEAGTAAALGTRAGTRARSHTRTGRHAGADRQARQDAGPGHDRQARQDARPGHDAKPGKTPDPGATAKPGKTPDPGTTAKPGKTPDPGKPDATPDRGQKPAPATRDPQP